MRFKFYALTNSCARNIIGGIKLNFKKPCQTSILKHTWLVKITPFIFIKIGRLLYINK